MLKLDSILYIAALSLELGLIGLLVARRLSGRFRFFFAYLICTGIGDFAALRMVGNTTEYYVVYWCGRAISSLLILLVIRDIFKSAFRMVRSKLGWAGLALPSVLFLLIVFLFWRRVHHLITPSFLGLIAIDIYSFELGAAFIASVIFVAALWLRFKYGIWGQQNLGILAGFGLIGVSKLMAYFVVLNFGSRSNVFFQYMPSFAFLAAALVWLVTFFQTEEPSRPVPDPENLRKLLELLNQRIEMTRRIAERFGLRLRYSRT
jgi:hypothetical protein